MAYSIGLNGNCEKSQYWAYNMPNTIEPLTQATFSN